MCVLYVIWDKIWLVKSYLAWQITVIRWRLYLYRETHLNTVIYGTACLLALNCLNLFEISQLAILLGPSGKNRNASWKIQLIDLAPGWEFFSNIYLGMRKRYFFPGIFFYFFILFCMSQNIWFLSQILARSFLAVEYSWNSSHSNFI